MKLSIFGSSKIINHHLTAAKKNSFEIFSICTSNKNSKNVNVLAKKFNINKVFYDWKKFIKNSYENNCCVLIAGRIKDNKKVLTHCLKHNLKVLIEKPLFTSSKHFKKFFNYKKNIFVGYNRTYYRNIFEIKKIISKNSPQNIIIKCPEANIKDIALNTCHVISMLYILFGSIYLVKKIKSKNSIFCIFISKKKIPIYIHINFGIPDNFSFEFNFKSKRITLCPLETLIIYDKLEKKEFKDSNVYYPRISKILNEYKLSKLKPGFDLQYKNFRQFVKNQKSNFINIIDAKEIISICNKIKN